MSSVMSLNFNYLWTKGISSSSSLLRDSGRAFADSEMCQFLFSIVYAYLLVASWLFLFLTKITFFYCTHKKEFRNSAARCTKQFLNCAGNTEFDH